MRKGRAIAHQKSHSALTKVKTAFYCLAFITIDVFRSIEFDKDSSVVMGNQGSVSQGMGRSSINALGSNGNHLLLIRCWDVSYSER